MASYGHVMISAWTFGSLADGREVTAYELTSEKGFRAVILNYGAILQALHLPDGTNIVLGFKTLDEYIAGNDYRGAVIGRNANRIVGAAFHIDGVTHNVPSNEDENNLHSGPNGFDRQLWEATISGDTLRLKHVSPQGDQGFPGEVSVTLSITWIGAKLRLEMSAQTTEATPVNLTWHPYWNLKGSDRIDGHNLQVISPHRTKLNQPETIPVKDTCFDFRKSLPLGVVKLDENYTAVDAVVLKTARVSLEVTSSLPDVQIYTGDALPTPRSGIAIEPQFRPDDINQTKDSLLMPSERFEHWIEYEINIGKT